MVLFWMYDRKRVTTLYVKLFGDETPGILQSKGCQYDLCIFRKSVAEHEYIFMLGGDIIYTDIYQSVNLSSFYIYTCVQG